VRWLFGLNLVVHLFHQLFCLLCFAVRPDKRQCAVIEVVRVQGFGYNRVAPKVELGIRQEKLWERGRNKFRRIISLLFLNRAHTMEHRIGDYTFRRNIETICQKDWHSLY
jgi:hypothetical protein